jgi:hypothetical protein
VNVVRPIDDRARIILAAFALLFICQSAPAYEFPFNPSMCKRDPEGKFYVALGRYVFEMPYAERDNFVYDPLRPGDIGLLSPDASDPVGCFGNPLQSHSHAFAYRYHRMMLGKNAPPAEQKPGPDVLTLYRTSKKPSPAPNEMEWPGESSQLQLLETICHRATVREELSNGLIACRVKMINPPDLPQNEWGATYQARPEIYATPLGKLFAVYCDPQLFSSTIGSCNVAYTLKPGLGLSYKFQPYLGANAIPIIQIIDFDKALRATIEGELVKDYPWPEQGPTGGKVVENKP